MRVRRRTSSHWYSVRAAIPCLRHSSGVGTPASDSFKMPMICSSLNRVFRTYFSVSIALSVWRGMPSRRDRRSMKQTPRKPGPIQKDRPRCIPTYLAHMRPSALLYGSPKWSVTALVLSSQAWFRVVQARDAETALDRAQQGKVGIELSTLQLVKTIVSVNNGHHLIDDGLNGVVVLVPNHDNLRVARVHIGDWWMAVTSFCSAWSPRRIRAGLRRVFRTPVDRVICAEGLAHGEKFRLRRLPERRCTISVSRNKNSEVAELLSPVLSVAETKRLGVPYALKVSGPACFCAPGEGRTTLGRCPDCFRERGSEIPELRRIVRKCLWKLLFIRHRHSPSQSGNVGAMGICKVPATYRLVRRRCSQTTKEGGSDEGADCSARSARTADCGIAFTGV